MSSEFDPNTLSIICYPDPRLRKVCQEVTQFDERLAAIAARMLHLMRTEKGVGLAAPQVGILWRMFVANATGEPKDDVVLVNPVIRDPEGSKEAEEGCLSIPDVRVQVRRALRCRVTAQDLKGNPIELMAEDLPARIWQHETDHLNGVLILDRMGPSDRIATRKMLRDLEAAYQTRRSA